MMCVCMFARETDQSVDQHDTVLKIPLVFVDMWIFVCVLLINCAASTNESYKSYANMIFAQRNAESRKKMCSLNEISRAAFL